MATNNEELRQQALSSLAEGRAEISAEVQHLRQHLSPVRMLHRVVDRHTGLVVLVAIATGIIPVALLFRNKQCPNRKRAPVMISVSKQPPKPVLGALLLAVVGILAKTITAALMKSAVLPRALNYLSKRQPGLGKEPEIL